MHITVKFSIIIQEKAVEDAGKKVLSTKSSEGFEAHGYPQTRKKDHETNSLERTAPQIGRFNIKANVVKCSKMATKLIKTFNGT